MKRAEEKNETAIGNGSLKLPLRGKAYFQVWGGPYLSRPLDHVGIKLAAEITKHCDIDLPIRDFGVPSKEDLRNAVENAVHLILQGERVYIGCMGGFGRTGLFLAALAKTFGIKDSVSYVRRNYTHRAVETSEQQRLVEEFTPTQHTIDMIKREKFWVWFSPWKKNLTNSRY